MSDLEDILALQIKREGLPIPEREYRFHRHRRWKFDFCYPDRKLAFEVEGGIFSGGAHTRGKHFQSDCEKYNTATLMGWRVFRLHGDMIYKGKREIDDGWQLIQEVLLLPFPDPGPSIYDACPAPSV